MDPVSALKTGAEAVSLVSAVAKLIKESKGKQQQTNLGELLERLHIEAMRLSKDLEYRLRGLVERTSEYGLNPAKSLDQQLADLSWYNVITRSRMKSFREECGSIYRQLTSFLDDATALMLCDPDAKVMSEPFMASLQTKRLLDGLFLQPDLPVRDLLDGMLATAERVTAELQSV